MTVTEHVSTGNWAARITTNRTMAAAQALGTCDTVWTGTGSQEVGLAWDAAGNLDYMYRGVYKFESLAAAPTGGYLELFMEGNPSDTHTGGSPGLVLVGTTLSGVPTTSDWQKCISSTALSGKVRLDGNRNTGGQFSCRFQLNAAGLTYLAAGGTQYLAVVHDWDRSATDGYEASKVCMVALSNESHAWTERRPRLVLMDEVEEIAALAVSESDIYELSVDAATFSAAGADAAAQIADTTDFIQVREYGANPAVTLRILMSFNLTAYAGKECIFAELGYHGYQLGGDNVADQMNFSVVKVPMNHTTLTGQIYDTGKAWTNVQTFDREATLYPVAAGLVNGRSGPQHVLGAGIVNPDLLTQINNVLDGTDKYPADTLNILISNDINNNRYQKIGNPDHATLISYGQPYLILGLTTPAAVGGAASRRHTGGINEGQYATNAILQRI